MTVFDMLNKWLTIIIHNMLISLLFTWIYIMDLLGRKRIILDRESDEPYLERYYIFLKNRTTFPFNMFIHKFLKSDPDDLHDHPWGFTTFIFHRKSTSKECCKNYVVTPQLDSSEPMSAHMTYF